MCGVGEIGRIGDDDVGLGAALEVEIVVFDKVLDLVRFQDELLVLEPLI